MNNMPVFFFKLSLLFHMRDQREGEAGVQTWSATFSVFVVFMTFETFTHSYSFHHLQTVSFHLKKRRPYAICSPTLLLCKCLRRDRDFQAHMLSFSHRLSRLAGSGAQVRKHQHCFFFFAFWCWICWEVLQGREELMACLRYKLCSFRTPPSS